jgi:hypothetical protein
MQEPRGDASGFRIVPTGDQDELGEFFAVHECAVARRTLQRRRRERRRWSQSAEFGILDHAAALYVVHRHALAWARTSDVDAAVHQRGEEARVYFTLKLREWYGQALGAIWLEDA